VDLVELLEEEIVESAEEFVVIVVDDIDLEIEERQREREKDYELMKKTKVGKMKRTSKAKT